MDCLPAVFISHGAPDLPIREGAAQTFLKTLGHKFPKPRAILVISAHWNTSIPTVSTAPQPQTIYDFSGFPNSLYQLNYAAPGAPALAEQAVTLLDRAGLACKTHPTRGLDHGAWTPLMLMYPQADIPVTQLSIQYQAGAAHHFRVGSALASLRQEGVLIVASGAATHNLSALGAYNAEPPDWAKDFDNWLADAICGTSSDAAAQHQINALLNYRQLAPYVIDNHPTEEHLLPLFVALGAGGVTARRVCLHRSYTYSVLSMAAYAFD